MKGREISAELWIEIRDEYVAGRATLAQLALRHGIGKSTIMNKASSERWSALRKGESLELNDAVNLQREPRKSKSDRDIIDDAITILHQSLPDARLGSKESVCTALVKLVELRQKIDPPTVADLVERAIELGVGPQEFLSELKRQWDSGG